MLMVSMPIAVRVNFCGRRHVVAMFWRFCGVRGSLALSFDSFVELVSSSENRIYLGEGRQGV